MIKRPVYLTLLTLAAAGALCLDSTSAGASDHLDTPSVIADSRADIGDVYAWMSPDARRLNLVMTIVGHSLGEKLSYIFHIDSSRVLGGPSASVDIVCKALDQNFTCAVGGESVSGRFGDEDGATSSDGRIRAFAGLRDDPFFNNVRGTREAYNVAKAALASGAQYDAAGCPHFSQVTASEILERWRSTNGGPASDFLKGWTPASIVVSIDKKLVAKGGPLLGIWGATKNDKEQIDRAARPLTGNALLATLGSSEDSDALKEKYNRVTPSTAGSFVPELAKGVALYDGLDGRCGDGFLIAERQPGPERYYPLASLLADDRLWVDSRYGRCTALFAVERAALNHERGFARDCGGRMLEYDAVNSYRSLVAGGRSTGLDDGVHRDEMQISGAAFPFLAPPAQQPAK